MGYSFTDLGAEGCRRSLNALLRLMLKSKQNEKIKHYVSFLVPIKMNGIISGPKNITMTS